MYRIVVSILGAFWLVNTVTYGMKCPPGESTSALDLILDSCPRWYENATQSYCCMDEITKSMYCCEKDEYSKNETSKAIGPGIIAVAVIVPVIILAAIGLCWRYKTGLGQLYTRTSNT